MAYCTCKGPNTGTRYMLGGGDPLPCDKCGLYSRPKNREERRLYEKDLRRAAKRTGKRA
jgi:hypothetical protein